jgi:protein subunit release factor A
MGVGVGGTEASYFVHDLARVYERYAAFQNWECETSMQVSADSQKSIKVTTLIPLFSVNNIGSCACD